MFQQPSQGDRFSAAELLGSLCLFYVHEVRQGINTAFGEREAISCDVHVLDGPKAGESMENALVFQGGLIGSLRSAGGADPVLARIGQGVAKPGQTAPYVLNPFTDADAKLAQAWIAARPKFTGPTTTAPGATPAATPATAAAPTAPANGTAPKAGGAAASPASVDLSKLPPEVQELLKQTGAMTV